MNISINRYVAYWLVDYLQSAEDAGCEDGQVLSFLRRLERRVSLLTPAASDRAINASSNDLYFIRGELVDEAPEM